VLLCSGDGAGVATLHLFPFLHVDMTAIIISLKFRSIHSISFIQYSTDSGLSLQLTRTNFCSDCFSYARLYSWLCFGSKWRLSSICVII